MVWIAVCNVWLVSYSDFCRDLIPYIIVASNLCCIYSDVWIESIEFLDILGKDFSKIASHSVVEGDCDGTSVISALWNLEGGGCSTLLLSASGKDTHYKCQNQSQDNDSFLHNLTPYD